MPKILRSGTPSLTPRPPPCLCPTDDGFFSIEVIHSPGSDHDAEGVLAQRLAEIRTARAAVRTKRISLEEHFTPEELEALSLAFSRTDADNTGFLEQEQLASAFGQVGMAPTAEDIASVVVQLGKGADEGFVFAEFAQLADMLSPVEG